MRHLAILVAVAAILAGPEARPGAAPPPDLSGPWSGTTKGKEATLEPGDGWGARSSTFSASFLQAGGDLSILLAPAGSPSEELAGLAGNRSFWAAGGGGDALLVLAGRSDAKGNRLSGGLIAGRPDGASDLKFKGARTALSTLAASGPARTAAAAAAAVAPAPSIEGAWKGTLGGKATSLEPGAKSRRVRIPVTLTVTLSGTDAAGTLTLLDGKGDSLSLAGKAAAGVFWLGNGDPGAPVLFAGSVAGRAPRLKAKARGILAKEGEFTEATLSLKRSAASVQGTAAAGAAVAGATVTLKDRDGTAVTAVTGEDGRFVLDAAGLAPPFLLEAGGMYGVATGAGVANLHPLSDLILRTWYGLKGLDLAASFAGLDGTTPVPTPVEVDLLEALVERAVQKWLVDEGIDPSSFDLLRTPFAADGTGLDAVLDGTTVSPDGSSLTITDGTTTQDSTFTLSGVPGTVEVETTVASPAGTSESRDGTALPGGSAMEAAVAGGIAAMDALCAKVTARGAALTAADLAPFLAEDFREQGEPGPQWCAELVTGMRGGSMGPVELRSVVSFDAAAGVVDLELILPMSNGAYSAREKARMAFRKTGPAWLLLGDGRIADVQVGVEFRTDLFSWGIEGPRRYVNVQVTPNKGLVQSVTVSGGGLFSGTAVPKLADTRIITLKPTPATEVDYEFDMFHLGVDVPAFPAPGTEFQVTVTPVSGPPQVCTVISGATSTEAIQILQPSGHDLAADAHPGTPFTARWTRPTTFAVESMEFSGTGYSAHYAMDVDADAPVPLAGTEGSVTIPATAGGEAVTRADFFLSFDGPNGERIVVVYGFD